MSKQSYYLLGTVFIIASGLIFSLERFISYYSWIGQMGANTGSFQQSPELPSLFTNIFVPCFILIGVRFFILGYKEKQKNN